MPPDCPYAPRIAARLADPAARLDDDLARHLPGCEACRAAASVAIRARPTNYSAAPSLAEWLGESHAPATIVSQFQAEAIVGGRTGSLELGPYLLLDRLGIGGMGDVYRAWHRLLRREDAVKTVRPELASNASALKRFLREAEAAAKLRHPNVVQVYTADRAGPGYYLAMEFVPGTDLGKLVCARGPLPEATACAYVRQAADGLHHAYTSGLVHRDVKPANLLVTRDGLTVKVADFGLVRAFEDGAASEFTSSGAVLGTIDYMAPEQAEDAHAADTRADVYALGCTLYFLLVGAVPYPGGTIRNKLERHATAPVPDVVARPPVSGAVNAIVKKCMAKRPEDRYQTPGEVSAALRALDPNVPRVVAVAPSDPFDMSALAPQEQPTEALSKEEALRERDEPRRREPVRVPLWAGAAVLLALAVVVVAALKWPKGSESAKIDPQPDPPARPNLTVPTVRPKEPNPKRPTAVPLPKPAPGGAPWNFVSACWSARTDKVRVVGFLADGSICAGRAGQKELAGSDSGYWEVWSKAGGAAIRSHRPDGTADYELPMCVHPNALVTDRFRRLDPTTFRPIEPLVTNFMGIGAGRGGSIDAARPTGNGKFVVGSVSPEGEGETRHALVAWEAATGHVRTGRGVDTSDDMKTVATDHTGETIATTTVTGRLVVFSASGKRNREWDGPNPANEVALSPDGKKLYSAHRDKGVCAWTIDDGKLETELPLAWMVRCAVTSPDGRWLATVGEAVVVWDLEAKPRAVGYELAEHWTGDLMSVAFSADGNRLVVGGWARRGDPPEAGEGVVWLWELKP
jgi:serine/threonine protein kinase